MRWRLLLEEFGPELGCIKGKRNVVAAALSRLNIDNAPEVFNVTEAFGYDDDDLPADSFPVKYRTIAKAQKKDEVLLQKLLSHDDYREIPFRGGDKTHDLICKNGKIFVPQTLQRRLVHWYHKMLCHPGETRTELTIRQHFDWKGLRKTVHDICHKCESCQKRKVSNQKYGKLPPKETEVNLWDTLCVNLIGPYKIPYEGRYMLTAVNNNGTVRFQKGRINNVVNIWRIKPFHA
jgi:hypothetical protein